MSSKMAIMSQNVVVYWFVLLLLLLFFLFVFFCCCLFVCLFFVFVFLFCFFIVCFLWGGGGGVRELDYSLFQLLSELCFLKSASNLVTKRV